MILHSQTQHHRVREYPILQIQLTIEIKPRSGYCAPKLMALRPATFLVNGRRTASLNKTIARPFICPTPTFIFVGPHGKG